MIITDFLTVGADIASPLNKSIGASTQPIMSAGAQLSFFKILKINGGVTGNANGFDIPLGISLSALGYYEIYVGTNDILTYLGMANNPEASFALCALRFNLPPKKPKPVQPTTTK